MSVRRIVPLLLILASACSVAGEQARTTVFVLPSKVRVSVVEAAFSTRNFKVEGCGGESESCLVDGRAPFGVVGELPRSYVEKLQVSYAGKTYVLDSSDMYDAWGGRKLSVNGIRYFGGECTDAGNCEFRGVFADGAASFAAEWKIVSGRPSRTVLTDSGDIVDLFLRNIDPPTFE